MKKIIIILSLFFFNNAHAQDLYLRDLNEVIKQEESVSNYVYIFERDRHDRYGNDTSR